VFTNVLSRIAFCRGLLALSLVAGLTLASVGSAIASAPRYDVSYLWHGGLNNVYQYRQQVARVLGPGVAKNLKIAMKPGLYGLIYHRKGDSHGATRVAKAHSRLLRARGLESASPIRSRNWTFVGESKKVQIASLGYQTIRLPKPLPEVLPRPVSKPVFKPVFKPVSKPAVSQEIRDLETAVEKYIKQMRSKGRIARDERTAWSVFDFTSGEKLVGINEDVQFQGASLVKPFFALAFFHRVKVDGLSYGPKSRRHMQRMIQYSSNSSTNWIMRRVGGPAAIQRILKQNYPGIFEDTRIVEYIPAGGRTYRNKASVHDYSRFLYALWQGDIPGTREIKRLMALPGPDRLFTGATDIPRGTRVYNKTGSTAHVCGDMGILVVRGKDGRRYPYILVGVIEKQQRARNYGSWIKSRGNVIRRVSNLVYQGITQHHGIRS
jgi:beta-lactamase class A